MSASDLSSTKCSGFFLRSSSPIRPTRARHLYSVDTDNTGTNRIMISAILNISRRKTPTLATYTCWLTGTLQWIDFLWANEATIPVHSGCANGFVWCASQEENESRVPEIQNQMSGSR